jgi:hypothetical protein
MEGGANAKPPAFSSFDNNEQQGEQNGNGLLLVPGDIVRYGSS